ncbi:DUF935 domain-containing protein [Calidifontimicrobium sp. SYSU G02091]|uniref:DUF935 domain-containing protein n=1 Tax=Calidifontimicrobium sp. SYSU G02091 TaxID=2926421 RepID=UPI001F533BD6|nr:DUF935 domain-containing protein [Calidifontimicrobium sp. SYSU G02091]MCI1193411.1 DUF935 domain-containing protein [Calidifontimicrobium sp. SYSU G02091]
MLDLKTPIAMPSQAGLRSVWQWRPLASMTPAMVADVLRRASMGDAHDFLLAADDIREKDLHYRAVLQTRTLAVAGLPVSILARDDSRAAKRAADLVRDAITDQDISQLAAHLMDAVAKGYAVAEILWDTSGRIWYPREIVPREAHWFTFDRDTGRLLRLVDGSAEGATMPPYRMIVHTPPLSAGIPLLGGVARSALWAWVFKSFALRDWARFAELFGQPIRVGKYHQGASPDDVAVLRQAAFSLGSDAAAVIPQEMALELVESGSKSASADLYHKLIDYLDRQVSKAVLGQTMTTDDGSSQAQARVHEQVRRDILEADARALEQTITRDLISPIVRLNLGEDAPLPIVDLVVEAPEDMAALADQVAKLAGAGVAIPQTWVRGRFGIPEPQDGEAVVGAEPASAGEPLANTVANRARTHGSPVAVHGFDATKNAQNEYEPDELDRLVDEATGEWQAQIGPAAHALQDVIDQAQADGLTAQELSSRLAAALDGIPIEALTEALERAQFAARLAGVHGREPEPDRG